MAAVIGGFQGGFFPDFMFICPTDTKIPLQFCRIEKENVAFTNFFLYLCKKYNIMFTFVFVYQGVDRPLRCFGFPNESYDLADLFCSRLMKHKQNAFVISRFYRWSKNTAVYRNTSFFRTTPFPLNPYDTSEEFYYLSPKKYNYLVDNCFRVNRSDYDYIFKKLLP